MCMLQDKILSKNPVFKHIIKNQYISNMIARQLIKRGKYHLDIHIHMSTPNINPFKSLIDSNLKRVIYK